MALSTSIAGSMAFSSGPVSVKKGSGGYGTAVEKEYALARIAGVNIPTHKRVPIALTYITGIGLTSAKEICASTNVDETRRVNELSDAEVLAIREHIDATYTVEGDLRRENPDEH